MSILRKRERNSYGSDRSAMSQQYYGRQNPYSKYSRRNAIQGNDFYDRRTVRQRNMQQYGRRNNSGYDDYDDYDDYDYDDTMTGKILSKMTAGNGKGIKKQQPILCNNVEYDPCICSGKYYNVMTGEVVDV